MYSFVYNIILFKNKKLTPALVILTQTIIMVSELLIMYTLIYK
jgi:hypothetical protein